MGNQLSVIKMLTFFPSVIVLMNLVFLLHHQRICMKFRDISKIKANRSMKFPYATVSFFFQERFYKSLM